MAARRNIQVPFGFEAPDDSDFKGIVFVMDSFEGMTLQGMQKLVAIADERRFNKLVLYPQNEQTLKRLGIKEETPYYKRIDQLKDLIEEAGATGLVTIDQWEGKRKKYTPIDTAVDFLTSKHEGPYFLCVYTTLANQMIAFTSFQTLIKQVRVLIMNDGKHPLREEWNAWQHRWDLI
ncbi:hypothetical protein BHU72_10180 [Desulfuribacillus stibiiarsenatis]|uniref:Uncharacterized protein n=1 Tax=Desulfuribacillus stibiiarsenatis TaxID=1390249 RepID=A0A1E5L9B3_9FIRM|nr:hypothetical protein [Desulfuribacillus stibiiarsenatis]OEH86614.1 hypothetical protein BHU72_10180 [Desulfuribacillus stibiiarsenatis]